MSLSCIDSDILSFSYFKNKKRNVILNAAFYVIYHKVLTVIILYTNSEC